MPQGQQAIPEIQWAIIGLAKLVDHEQIGLCLNLSTRSVKRVITHFHQYGTIPIPGNTLVMLMSRYISFLHNMPRKLTCLLSQFLQGTMPKTPDIYLDKLQEMLQASCGT